MKRTAACLSAFAAAIFFSFPVLAGPASEAGTAADGSGQKTQQVQDNPNLAPVKDQEGTVTLIAAGDDLIHANIYRRAFRPETGTYDFHSLYEPVKDVISSYDLAVINQETILVDNPAMYSSYPAFGTPQEIGEALADTGFDIILSATNHTWDKGEYGVRNTLNYWKTNYPDITLLGIHDSPEDWNTIDIVEKNGIRMAMFNYTYGLNGMHLPGHAYYMVDLLGNRAKFLGDVRAAENLADITICFLHIGEEYHMQPTAFQMSYVQTLVDTVEYDHWYCGHYHVDRSMTDKITVLFNSVLEIGTRLQEVTRELGVPIYKKGKTVRFMYNGSEETGQIVRVMPWGNPAKKGEPCYNIQFLNSAKQALMVKESDIIDVA